MDRKMTVKFIRSSGRELAKLLGRDVVAEGNAPANAAAAPPNAGEHAPHACGSFTISNTGKVNVSTLPASFPRVVMEVIGKVVLSALSTARELDSPLTELAADFPGLEVRARDADGGAIIFITPQEF
jgi:hypothetical protein